MTQVLDAVDEKGIFRLLDSPTPDLQAGQTVWISVEIDSVADILMQTASIYADLDENKINEIETIVLDRSSFLTDPCLLSARVFGYRHATLR